MLKSNHAVEECRKPGRPRDEAVREKILAAAVELMEESGYARLTCDAIAQRAGAGKATIYRWWQNKAGVVIDAFVESVTPELPNQRLGSLDEYVTVHLRRFAKVLLGSKGRFLAAVIAAAQDDPEVETAFISHWLKPRRQVSRRILEEYRAEGELRSDADLELVLDAMYGPLHFVLLVRHSRTTAAYAENLAALILNGLKPR
ncbi:MAG: TetR/AcrR family transcriptional regulator [Acidobacteria bacterium]|nr:TetR/AcrR family transcriptional regulator [Acidobacteriota bacterium]